MSLSILKLTELMKVCTPDFAVNHNVGNSAVMTFELRESASGPNLLLKEKFRVCTEKGEVLETFDNYPNSHDIMTTMLRHAQDKAEVNKVFELINVAHAIHEACIHFESQLNLQPKHMILHPTLHYALANSGHVRGHFRVEADLVEGSIWNSYMGMVVENARNDYDEYHAITLKGDYK